MSSPAFRRMSDSDNRLLRHFSNIASSSITRVGINVVLSEIGEKKRVVDTRGEEMIIRGAREQLAEKAAWILGKTIQAIVKSKKRAVIAVPGGRSAADIFKNLRKQHLAWERVHVFLLDERLVPADHQESNYRLVRAYLGSEEQPVRIHQFKFDPADPWQGVIDYGKELQACGGGFDIVLASSGEDGHIASLFPNHHSVESRESGFILMDDAPKPPPARMSASYELIRKANTGIVLFFGGSKQHALQNFLNIHLTDVACPAKIMARLSHYYVLTDQEVDIL